MDIEKLRELNVSTFAQHPACFVRELNEDHLAFYRRIPYRMMIEEVYEVMDDGTLRLEAKALISTSGVKIVDL